MEPIAPDWRTIGSTAGPAPAQASPRRALPPARHVAWVAGACLVTSIVGAMAALLVMPSTGGVTVEMRDADAVPMAAMTQDAAEPITDVVAVVAVEPNLLVIDVEGAVARPGLVHVPAGARVGDALRSAGGYRADADLAAAAATINLAQEVTDGLKIVVPAIGDPSRPDGGTGPTTGPGDGPIDLNRATESTLDSLPGVGPATIAKIVAAREEAPFRSVDDLRARGIVGESTLARLRDLVTVGE